MAQKENPQNVELLSTHFQARDEPQFALSNAISHILGLPALRAFWTGGANHIAGNYNYLDDIACNYDLIGSGAGARLTSGFAFNSELAPISQLINNGYWYLPDNAQFDIIGTEPFVHPISQGITLGGWFNFYAGSIGAWAALMSKWDSATNNRSYMVYKTNTDLPRFIISPDGTAVISVTGTMPLISGKWYHIVGQYETATQDISLWLDGEQTTINSGVASIFNSTSDFRIGADGTGALNFTGGLSLCFLCGGFVRPAFIKNLWQQTRYLFRRGG